MGESGNEILFFTGDIKFVLRNKIAVAKWLHAISRKHKKKITSLNYIFVGDDYLLNINKRFLRHNTLTDIISFDYSADKKAKNGVVGEIYISIPRVHENAAKFKVSKTEELHRVMAHGLLHLCGFGDKTPGEIKRMRAEEDKALGLRQI
jgi:probable rRNA maturation factor